MTYKKKWIIRWIILRAVLIVPLLPIVKLGELTNILVEFLDDNIPLAYSYKEGID